MTGVEHPAPTRMALCTGEEIVHSRRKRRGQVNPLVVGSNPTGPRPSRVRRYPHEQSRCVSNHKKWPAQRPDRLQAAPQRVASWVTVALGRVRATCTLRNRTGRDPVWQGHKMSICRTPYRLLRVLALAMLVFALCRPVGAAELELEGSLKSQAAALLRAGNFTKFDTLATQLRETSARTPAGAWKLSMFYSGVWLAGSTDANDAAWARLEAGTAGYLAEHPDSPTAVVLEAKVLIEHAAVYRGGEYASQVPQSHWAPFRSYVDATLRVLDRDRELGSADPEWYAIYVWALNLRDAPGQEILAFTREALERYPQYYPIHYRAARALLPKWHGSKALMQQYLALAQERTQASEGTQIYGRVMFNLARNSNRPLEEFTEIGAQWAPFKASYEEILRAYPDPYNLGALRAMACLTGNKEDYKAITQRVSGPAPSVAWFDTPQKQQACDDWALRNKSLAPWPLAQRLLNLHLAPLLPFLMAVLVGLLRLFRRRASSPADTGASGTGSATATATKPIDGMGEIGVPLDQ